MGSDPRQVYGVRPETNGRSRRTRQRVLWWRSPPRRRWRAISTGGQRRSQRRGPFLTERPLARVPLERVRHRSGVRDDVSAERREVAGVGGRRRAAPMGAERERALLPRRRRTGDGGGDGGQRSPEGGAAEGA